MPCGIRGTDLFAQGSVSLGIDRRYSVEYRIVRGDGVLRTACATT
jgi:hypothetical protein